MDDIWDDDNSEDFEQKQREKDWNKMKKEYEVVR